MIIGIKLPRTRLQFEDQLANARARGFAEGAKQTEERFKRNTEQQRIRLQALEASGRLVNALAQAIESHTRAMQSEAGQL